MTDLYFPRMFKRQKHMEWDGIATIGCFIRKATKGKYFFKIYMTLFCAECEYV